MRDAIAWVRLRLGLYIACIATAIVGGGLIYDAAHGFHGIVYFGHSIAHPGSWLPQAAGAISILSIYMLIVLVALSIGRKRLPNAVMKMILLPLLLIPVGIIDLAGTTPPYTLGFLAVQLFYLIVVRMNRIQL